MFKRILLAYDGSAETDGALEQAAELARMSNAELHLLGVVAVNNSAALAVGYAPVEFFTAEQEAIEQALQSAVDRLGEHLSVHSKIREGDPAEQIAAQAADIDADLVVIGHGDKGFLARWFEGSTGAKLIRNLPCSMLVAT